jgi:hypothetical protein
MQPYSEELSPIEHAKLHGPFSTRNFDVEIGVIGAAIMYPDRVRAMNLNVDHFAWTCNRLIFSAIMSIIGTGHIGPVMNDQLAAHLPRDFTVRRAAGGKFSLAGYCNFVLDNSAPARVNTKHAVEVLRAFADLRCADVVPHAA